MICNLRIILHGFIEKSSFCYPLGRCPGLGSFSGDGGGEKGSRDYQGLPPALGREISVRLFDSRKRPPREGKSIKRSELQPRHSDEVLAPIPAFELCFAAARCRVLHLLRLLSASSTELLADQNLICAGTRRCWVPLRFSDQSDTTVAVAQHCVG